MDGAFFITQHRPIIGIFVNSKQINFLKTQNTSAKLSAIIKASQAAKVTPYFFSLIDVDLTARRINGTFFHEAKGLWTKKVFPYPDVLYARGGSIKQWTKYKHFIIQLNQMGVKRINSGPVFNKWHVFKILKENMNLAPHLPATKVYAAADDLKLMLKKYNKVYLKACRGRKGKQVMQVKSLANNSFEYRYFNHKLIKKIISFAGLAAKINKFFDKKPFIIQEAIDLPCLNDSIYDLRAEVQRNGQGELEIVEILVRVGQPGAPITQHASSYLFDHFFSRFTNYPKEQIDALKHLINKFLANIYHAIEAYYGPYGEIGIDFAIDKIGRLWFIECNSRPAKVSLFKAANEETRQKAYQNPFAYAKFLYNQNNRN